MWSNSGCNDLKTCGVALGCSVAQVCGELNGCGVAHWFGRLHACHKVRGENFLLSNRISGHFCGGSSLSNSNEDKSRGPL